jgi:DNA-binding CsgD family transcriptional regulator
VLVTGEPGAGRSRLLAEALAALDPRSFTVLTVEGVQSEAEIPFGAFAHLLPTRPGLDGQANPLRWAAETLDPGEGTLVLAVDDAHLLDRQSAALVRHLAVHRGALVAVTARDGAAVPEPILALENDGALTRVELRPLPLPEAGQLLAAALRGRVEGATVRRLWHATCGNIRLLAELIAAGLATGALRAGDDRTWRWQGELSLSSRLRRLVEAGIGDLDDDEREVLELIAFGEPIDADVLMNLTAPGAVERVERRRLIVTLAHGRGIRVRLAHPIHVQVVREWSGPLSTRNRLGRIVRLGPREERADAVPDADLTAREREVAQLASWNLTNREIAEWLALSPRTVANHLCRVYTKLGVSARNELSGQLV